MNASQTRRARKGHRPLMDRASAERLLNGDLAGSAMRDDRLVRLLTAAAAPGRDRELAGEQTAVTAFTQQLSQPPGQRHRRRPGPGWPGCAASRH